MSFEIPLDEVDTKQVGGFEKVSPGFYHAYITDVEEQGGKKGEMVVYFQILRGTTPGQEGISHREQFSREPKQTPIKKVLALAIACGLTTRDELDRMKDEGRRPELEFTQCIGRQVCLHLEPSTGTDGKSYFGMHWDEVWHPFDKRASKIPLDASWLASGGYVLPAGRPLDGMAAPANTTNTGTKPQGNGKTTGLERPAPGTPASKDVAEDVLAGVLG